MNDSLKTTGRINTAGRLDTDAVEETSRKRPLFGLRRPVRHGRTQESCLQRDLDAAERLLFACAAAQAGGDPDAVDRALCAPGLDWPAAVRMSLQHGMAPLVARQLRCFPDDPRIPSNVAVCFARILEANVFRNRVLFRETARLARALETAGISFLALKGIGLALTVYADPALRSFADIDILVRPEDLDAADRAAQRSGFRREDGGVAPVFHHSEHVAYCAEDILTGTLAPEFDARLSAETIARLGHRVPLEIHIGLFRLPSGALRRVDMAPFWEQAQTVLLPDGTLMRIPSPEAMLVHLAAHAAGDLFRKLIFPVDIALLLRRYEREWDWRRVEALAERYAAHRDLRLLLEFVADCFGLKLPSESRISRMPRRNTDHSSPSFSLFRIGSCRQFGPKEVEQGFLSMTSVSSASSVIQTTERGKREAPLTPAAIFAAMRVDGRALVWQRWRRAQNQRERLLSLGQVLFPAPATMRRFYGVRSPLQMGIYYLLRPFHLAARLGRAVVSVRHVRDPHSRRQTDRICHDPVEE